MNPWLRMVLVDVVLYEAARGQYKKYLRRKWGRPDFAVCPLHTAVESALTKTIC